MGLGAFRDKLVGELSTGSRRIVELACILAQDPTVLLLDEPSAGVAQRETEALGPLLRRVQALHRLLDARHRARHAAARRRSATNDRPRARRRHRPGHAGRGARPPAGRSSPTSAPTRPPSTAPAPGLRTRAPDTAGPAGPGCQADCAGALASALRSDDDPLPGRKGSGRARRAPLRADRPSGEVRRVGTVRA